jgi:GMP synthase (glutamine-hydrolysing)
MSARGAARGRARPARKAPVLVLLHQEHSTPGRVGRMLQEMGHTLDIRRPRFDDPLPDTLAGHAGLVIFGGPMSANDPDPFIGQEIGFIGVALREQAPFLGICLGAQMLARHLGGRVDPHPLGEAEIGYYPLRPTPQGLDLARRHGFTWPSQVYQWHREGFECPAGAECLATADCFPVQAISVGRTAYGLQFHPDVTHAMIHRWTTRGSERLALPGARPREAHLADWYAHDAAKAAWTRHFLTRWLADDARDVDRSHMPAGEP